MRERERDRVCVCVCVCVCACVRVCTHVCVCVDSLEMLTGYKITTGEYTVHLLQECGQGYRVIAMELSNFVHSNLVALSMTYSLDPPIWISICIALTRP